MTPSESAIHVDVLARELAVSVAPDRWTLRQDEPLHLTFQVRLVAGEPLILIEGGDYRNRRGRPESYALAAIDVERGRSLPIRDAGPQLGGVVSGRPLSVDKPFRRRLLVAHWVRFEAAGAHRIVIDKQLRCAEAPWSVESIRRPAAEIGVQVATTLAVQPPDHAALGSVIDELGRRTLAADDTVWREAEQALATVEDSRVVSHYVRLLQGAGERPFVALKRLCRHGTDEALHALGQALASPAYRSYEVVLGIGANPHAGALALLWSFRRDEAANIRLAVLQGVFQRRPVDCLEKARLFLDDPDSSVREEARRIVAELGG
jgi:hypothetical protein